MKPKKLKKQNRPKREQVMALLLLLGCKILAQIVDVSLNVVELGNTVIPPCEMNFDAALFLSITLATDPVTSQLNNLFIYVAQFNATQPLCTQASRMVITASGTTLLQQDGPMGPDNSGPVGPTWTFTKEIRENTASPARLGLTDYTNSLPSPLTRAHLTSLIQQTSTANQISLSKGVLLFLFETGGNSYYTTFTLEDGFYKCFPSCQTCSGTKKNDCTACKPFAPILGATIDPSLTGQCFCNNGAPNDAGTGCQDTKCHKSCKTCDGAGASKCISCADGYEPEDPAKVGLKKCKRKPASGQNFACHSTCHICRGSRKDHCTQCTDLSEGVQLTLKAGECRCPLGKYLTPDEDACADCHSSCSQCTGPGADQCITCSNHLGIPIKAAGAKAGTCVNCADFTFFETPQCHGKIIRLKISVKIKTKPETAETIANEVFRNTKTPERFRKHVVPLDFGALILKQIKALGDQFISSHLLRVEVVGMTTPANYTFTETVNEDDVTHDFTFKFKKNHEKVLIIFEVIKSNYFLENLPTPTDRRRQLRNLQELSDANQAALDSTVLILKETITVELEGVYNVDQNKVDFVEETGVVIRVYTYASIFIASLALVMTMLGSKYDGRFVGRILDYSFFFCFLAKVPYIPAGFNTYELILMDELVMTDTIQMTRVFNENKVRSRLLKKFIEYRIPAIINNNATYFASFFFIGLIFLVILELIASKVKMGKVGVIARIIPALFICWSLPSTFFYSSLSTLFYSFTESYGGFRKVYYYSMGFLTWVISLGFIVFLSLTGVIWGYHGTQDLNEKISPVAHTGDNNTAVNPNPNTGTIAQQKAHNTYQKLSIEGLAECLVSPNTPGSAPAIPITLDLISIIRYAVYMLVIILFQNFIYAILVINLVLQIIILIVTTFLGCGAGQVESKITAGLYVAFEAVLTVFFIALIPTVVADREPTSDSGYWWGTVPLVTLILLLIVLKTAHLLVGAYLECKRCKGARRSPKEFRRTELVTVR